MVFSGSVPRNGIAGSYGTFLFSLQWTFVLFFMDLVTFIPTNGKRVLLPLFLSSIYCCRFCMLTFLTCVRWCHIVLLICSSLILTGVGHLFLCFSVEEGPCKSCAPIWLGCFFDIEVHKLFICFGEKFLMVSLYILVVLWGLSFCCVYGFLCCASAFKGS